MLLEPKRISASTRLNLPDVAASGTAKPQACASFQASAIDENTLRPVSRRDRPGLQPKALLALYCYALEIYGSAHVENLLSRDLNYRQLCQDVSPTRKSFVGFAGKS
jgi:transposase